MRLTAKRWMMGFAGVAYTLVILWLGTFFGASLSRHQAEIAIDDVQASLAFNRVLEGRKLNSLLSRGCAAAAAKQVDILLDQDTKLLASLYNGKLSPSTIKYIEVRDSTFLPSLATFKSKYGEIWREPDCP